MSPRLYLIGTSHVYQFGAGAAFGSSTCSIAQADAFRTILSDACKSYRIAAVAEELNEQALAEVDKQVSVPYEVASSLGLPHCYCEPNCDERASLRIREENAVIAFGQIGGKSSEEINRLVLVEWRKREEIWLERIPALQAWPVLFVCGALHIPTFTDLVRSRGIPCELIAENWEA